jgi:hypothetical protein
MRTIFATNCYFLLMTGACPRPVRSGTWEGRGKIRTCCTACKFTHNAHHIVRAYNYHLAKHFIICRTFCFTPGLGQRESSSCSKSGSLS